MKIKFKASLILLLSWLALILGAGTISTLVGMHLANRSLSTVDKTDIMNGQISSKVLKSNHPKIVSESEILRQVIDYVKIQQENLSRQQ